MTSSLDLPLGDLISANRSSGGGGRGRRRRGGGGNRDHSTDGNAATEGGASSGSAHPLDRTTTDDNTTGSGPVRNERRRERAPRNDAPYARERNDQRGGGGNWNRDLNGSSGAPSAIPKLIGDTVRLSNLKQDLGEDDLRYIFERIGT